MKNDPVFVFQDDKVYAMRNGKVVASGDDPDEVEEFLENSDKHDSENDELSEDETSNSEDNDEKDEKKSSHIVTPNGVKGKILSRTPDMWGLEDTLTVRLENGRIAHYKVADVDETEAPEETTNPIEQLEEEVAAETLYDRESLEQRQELLASVKKNAHKIASRGASDADMARIDRIVVEADSELAEIGQSIDHLDNEDVLRFQPPAPYETTVVEQGGRSDGAGWLDQTLNEMIDEAGAFDYEKEMNEGPEALVSELGDEAIADQGATKSLALSHISEKTAATDPTIREKYHMTYLARVEELRRKELSRRKENFKREAATKKDINEDAPDESLFF